MTPAAHKPLFFIGLHEPHYAHEFERCIININRLERRKSDFRVNDWMLDSGAFSRLTTGRGHMELKEYVGQIARWARCGNLVAAVSQDWMCEPFVLAKTGLTVEEHQQRTTANYLQLRDRVQSTYVLPVLQGYTPDEYRRHINQYGDALTTSAWVGVGSVCKRNGDPAAILEVLRAIHSERPDLRLHGFGLKRKALENPAVNAHLTSCDSLAWSYAARRQGRSANGPTEAHRYLAVVSAMPCQLMLEKLP